MNCKPINNKCLDDFDNLRKLLDELLIKVSCTHQELYNIRRNILSIQEYIDTLK